jgi:F0F1-type ATP synthase membrane subunit b/b'
MLQQLIILVVVLIPVLAVLVWRLVIDARRQEIARLHDEVAVARRERDEARAERDAAVTNARRERDRRIAGDNTMRLVAGTAPDMNTRLLLEQHLDSQEEEQS